MGASIQWLCGGAEVTVTGICPVSFLNECAAQGIPFEQAEPMNEYTIRLRLPNRLVKKASSAAVRCGCTMEVHRHAGGQRIVQRLRRRTVLVLGGAGMLLALMVSSLFLWDIQVTDNDSTVSDQRILRVLAEKGVGIGCFWPGLSGDLVRAAVLPELPELCWLAVNVHGSRAQVVVRAAAPVPEVLDEDENIRITAVRSGVIESIHVQEGEALVQPGDAVLAGDVLVDGVRPGGFQGPRAVRARADITARSWYELVLCAPLERQKKQPDGSIQRRFAVLLGKRRINCYFDGGILDGECDKITQIKPLEWEGVFSLPLALIRETICPCTVETVGRNEAELVPAMEAQLLEELARQMGETGEILSTRFDKMVVEGMLVMTLRAECRQSIAREESYTVSTDTNEPVEDTVWTEPLQWIG